MESNLQILRPISVLPFCHASCFTTILPPKLFEALEPRLRGWCEAAAKHQSCSNRLFGVGFINIQEEVKNGFFYSLVCHQGSNDLSTLAATDFDVLHQSFSEELIIVQFLSNNQ